MPSYRDPRRPGVFGSRWRGGGIGGRLARLGDFFSGPIGQLGIARRSMQEQAGLQAEQEADVDQQIADTFDTARRSATESLGAYDQASGEELKTLKNLQDVVGRRGNQYVDTATTGGQGLLNWATGNLEGYGEQQRADIDRSFDTALANQLSDMTRRGIRSTTAAGSQTGLNRELRSAEQRRLGEDLTRMRQDILGGIRSGNLNRQLGAMEYRNAGDYGAMGDMANYWGRTGANRADLIRSGYGAFGDALANVQYNPPPPNQYPGTIGRNLAGRPDPNRANMFD